MRFRIPYILAVLVLLAVFFLSFTLWSREGDTDLQVQAQKGLAWLLTYEGTYENPGVLWVLDDIQKKQCGIDSFALRIEERSAREIRTPAGSFYHAYRTEKSLPQIDTSVLPLYDRWLIEALRCSSVASSRLFQDELVREIYTGYDLTHQYIALTYLERLSCDDALAAPLTPLRDSVAVRIQQEDAYALHRFSDLSAERAAVLLWGGHGSLVSREWIDTISRNQSEDGGWKNAPEDTRANPHTTALALWALVQYTGLCPFTET